MQKSRVWECSNSASVSILVLLSSLRSQKSSQISTQFESTDDRGGKSDFHRHSRPIDCPPWKTGKPVRCGEEKASDEATRYRCISSKSVVSKEGPSQVTKSSLTLLRYLHFTERCPALIYCHSRLLLSFQILRSITTLRKQLARALLRSPARTRLQRSTSLVRDQPLDSTER